MTDQTSMTPNPSLIPVSQEAREAAADIWRDYVAKIGECMAEKSIRSGAQDDTLIVQAIALIAERATLAERERCAGAINAMADLYPDTSETRAALRNSAISIRQGPQS